MNEPFATMGLGVGEVNFPISDSSMPKTEREWWIIPPTLLSTSVLNFNFQFLILRLSGFAL